MKKFVISVLSVTVFSIGLGAVADKVAAGFKSDEKALALIKQARLAIGGEQSIAEVRSMVIKGNTDVTFKVDGAARTEQGETEIAMQLPDKLSKMVKIGHGDPAVGEKIMNEKHDVIIMRTGPEGDAVANGEPGKKVIIRKIDGGDGEIEKVVTTGKEGEFTSQDGKTIRLRTADGGNVEKVIVHGGKEEGMHERMGGHRQNELLRLTLSLLATPPAGMDVNYNFLGEGDVDGTPCSIVNAEFAGSSVKLYLAKTTSLPVMVSYQGHAMPRIMMFKTKAPEGADAKDLVTFNHKVDAPELSEVQLRFADYRSTGGVQLPYKWTTSVGGQTAEVFNVTSYEINPANIAEKFQNQKVMFRTKKDVQ